MLLDFVNRFSPIFLYKFLTFLTVVIHFFWYFYLQTFYNKNKHFHGIWDWQNLHQNYCLLMGYSWQLLIYVGMNFKWTGHLMKMVVLIVLVEKFCCNVLSQMCRVNQMADGSKTQEIRTPCYSHSSLYSWSPPLFKDTNERGLQRYKQDELTSLLCAIWVYLKYNFSLRDWWFSQW